VRVLRRVRAHGLLRAPELGALKAPFGQVRRSPIGHPIFGTSANLGTGNLLSESAYPGSGPQAGSPRAARVRTLSADGPYL